MKMTTYRFLLGGTFMLVLGVTASIAQADTAGAPGYAFMTAPGKASASGDADAMTQAIREQIRAKYGSKILHDDIKALRALADGKVDASKGVASDGMEHAVKFSSDSFKANPGAATENDARAIVAGMSPEQIRAVMEMAQALSGLNEGSQVNRDAPTHEKVVSVGNGMSSVIRDWISGIDENGQFYIENIKIPGSRVLMKKGDIVGSLGPVADLRISGGQTQITFASGNMILGDVPASSPVPGDDLSGEIIVSNPAPEDPAPNPAPETVRKTHPKTIGVKNDPKEDLKAKAPLASGSKFAPTISPRPHEKPPVPSLAQGGKSESQTVFHIKVAAETAKDTHPGKTANQTKTDANKKLSLRY